MLFHLIQKIPRWNRYILGFLIATLLLTTLLAGGLWWYFDPTVQRMDGVVYGQRHAMNLTMVFDIRILADWFDRYLRPPKAA